MAPEQKNAIKAAIDQWEIVGITDESIIGYVAEELKVSKEDVTAVYREMFSASPANNADAAGQPEPQIVQPELQLLPAVRIPMKVIRIPN